MILAQAAAPGGQVWEALRALVEAEGSSAHAFVATLAAADRRAPRDPVFAAPQTRRASDREAAPPEPERGSALPGGATVARRVDLGDATHALCAVHGAHRGLADEARDHPAVGVATAWLDEVARAMAAERGLLSRVVAAAGPLPSTPGQAQTDAAWATQRNAFRMLSRSDRAGVATGAAAALALDWPAVRGVLARAADAFGVAPPPLALPGAAETATVLDQVAAGPAAERALLFGARALLAQHRAFWDLLEARSSARRG